MVKAYYPDSLEAALLARRNDPGARIVAGGTDFMVAKPPADSAIFVASVPVLSDVKLTDGPRGPVLGIGACATYSDLENNPLVPAMLRDCVSQIAAPGIRNAGTIGGNACNASPAGDALPVLYALSARVRLASLAPDGSVARREIPIGEFILGVRKIALGPAEILESILLGADAWSNGTITSYRKIGARNAQAISKLSFAATFRAESGRVARFTAAFGSVGATTVRAEDIEARWIGASVADFTSAAREIRSAYEGRIKPIDDQRSTAKYRKAACLNLLEDFVRNGAAL